MVTFVVLFVAVVIVGGFIFMSQRSECSAPVYKAPEVPKAPVVVAPAPKKARKTTKKVPVVS